MTLNVSRCTWPMAHGQVIWCIFEKCIVPIIRQYPDLDPDDMEEAIKTTFPKPE